MIYLLLENHLVNRGTNDYLILHELGLLELQANLNLSIVHSNHTNDYFDPFTEAIAHPNGKDFRAPFLWQRQKKINDSFSAQ